MAFQNEKNIYNNAILFLKNQFKYFHFERQFLLIQPPNSIHHVLNILERRFEAVKNNAMKYFLMIRAFKNLQKSDFSITLTKSQLEKLTQNEIKELLNL